MRRSTALTFEMIKTSNRAQTFKTLAQRLKPLGIGAGVVGGAGLAGALAYKPLVNFNLDHIYSQIPSYDRMFNNPIQMDAADPFSTVANIRQRAEDANDRAQQTSNRYRSALRGPDSNETFFDRVSDHAVRSQVGAGGMLGLGYLGGGFSSPFHFVRKEGAPLASFN
jgi:hypothetical protein